MLEKSFYTKTEKSISDSFHKTGYVIAQSDKQQINEFREKITNQICKILKLKFPKKY